MSKRFGRNQKRKLKAEIAELKDEIEDLRELKDIEVKSVNDRLKGVIHDIIGECPITVDFGKDNYIVDGNVGFEINVNLRPFRLQRHYNKWKRYPFGLKNEIIKTITDTLELELDRNLEPFR